MGYKKEAGANLKVAAACITLQSEGYSIASQHIKLFDGKSIVDLINSGEYKPKHLKKLLKECAIIKKSYDESGLAKSKAKPTNDWQSYISIPGRVERDLAKTNKVIAFGAKHKDAKSGLKTLIRRGGE